MFDQEDGELNVVMGVLAGVIALVIGLVVAVVLSVRSLALAPDEQLPVAVVDAQIVPAETIAANAAEVDVVQFVDIEEVGEPMAEFHFEIGSSTLPGAALEELEGIVAELDSRPEAIALVSGFHDETGSADFNAAVARDRAVAVGRALIASGADAERVQLRRPAVTLGDGDAADARRVEVRVQ